MIPTGFLFSAILCFLLACPSTKAAAAVEPPYTEEWLTVPKTCPDTIVNGTGMALDPFASKNTDNWQDCCSFCHSQAETRCGAWTWHTKSKKCYVSTSGTPHKVSDAVSGGGAPPAPAPPMPKPEPLLGYQPNIVFILTDDQDRTLGRKDYTAMGSLEVMPKIQEKLIKEGTFMEHFYVNTPICCPSRTEFFTGRYFHNVAPPNDSHGTCMHADTSMAASNTTGLFGLMTKAGYNTGVFGKVTNDQSKVLKEAVSANSMSYIDSPLDYNNYMGTTYFRYFPNGTTYTENLDKTDPIFETAYQTAQIGNRTLRWLEGAIKESKSSNGRPFFAYIGPHAPPTPPPPRRGMKMRWAT